MKVKTAFKYGIVITESYDKALGYTVYEYRKSTIKERAYEIYRSLKDPIEKAKWRQWMKGKGWRTSHLK